MGCWSTKKLSASSPRSVPSRPRPYEYLPNKATTSFFVPELAQPVKESKIRSYDKVKT